MPKRGLPKKLSGGCPYPGWMAFSLLDAWRNFHRWCGILLVVSQTLFESLLTWSKWNLKIHCHQGVQCGKRPHCKIWYANGVPDHSNSMNLCTRYQSDVCPDYSNVVPFFCYAVEWDIANGHRLASSANGQPIGCPPTLICAHELPMCCPFNANGCPLFAITFSIAAVELRATS